MMESIESEAAIITTTTTTTCKVMVLVVGMQRDKVHAMLQPDFEDDVMMMLEACSSTTASVSSCTVMNDSEKETESSQQQSSGNHMPPNFIEAVNECIALGISKQGWKVVHALDLHHPNHCSFFNSAVTVSSSPGHDSGCLSHKKKHCVLGTWGSGAVTGLNFGILKKRGDCEHNIDSASSVIMQEQQEDLVLRGLDMDGDSHNAFWVTEPPHSRASPSRLGQLIQCMLDEKLLQRKIRMVLVICGTSPDGCIENTSAEALKMFPDILVCTVKEATWLRPTFSTMVNGMLHQLSLAELRALE